MNNLSCLFIGFMLGIIASIISKILCKRRHRLVNIIMPRRHRIQSIQVTPQQNNNTNCSHNSISISVDDSIRVDDSISSEDCKEDIKQILYVRFDENV